MPDYDRERRENSFIKMNCERDVDGPSRPEVENLQLEPDHQPGCSHYKRAPDYRPVLGLFRITEPVEFRAMSFSGDVVSQVIHYVAQVALCRRNRAQRAFAFRGEKQIAHMVEPGANHDDRGCAVND